MIVGTAGHVDHGKTSLVRALTGIDTDRLPEEKRRGITLELGFAHLPLPGGRVLGVIDVPGHERFVKAMAAGAGGVDIALLVVAADEGVMPQTREHVDICTLLGVRRGVLVVSKADLLPSLGDGWLELLEADLRGLVAGTPFEGATLVPVSAKSGAGLEALKTEIARLADELQASPDAARGADAPLFMPIDRAFSSKGFGLVVTGTLHSGRLTADGLVALLPDHPGPLRVRGLQVHGAAAAQAEAGTRVAVNLPELSVEQVRRGLVLTRAGQLPAVRALDVELQLLASVEGDGLARRSRQLLTLGTEQVEAIVRLVDVELLRPGERCFAQLRFARPIAALPGQRFILRGTRAIEGRGMTVAGGRVLVLNPPRRRAGAAEKLQRFLEAPLDERVRWLVAEAGYQGLDEAGLLARAQASPRDVGRALEKASARGAVVLIDREARRYVAGDLLKGLEARALARLDAFHHAAPERAGMPREELRQRLGEPPERVFARVLQPLLDARRVELSDELLRLPGRGRAFTEAAAAHRAKLLAALEAAGLTPPTTAELSATLRVPEARAVELGQALVAEGLAVRAGELFFARAAVERLQQRLVEYFATHERLSTQAFKDLTGLSRKFLIPLAEYFDREKVTLRVGDDRVIRRR
ncbi:MAG: selenocysteine-specific translation elongation factor [Myxococcota bacterium]